MSNTKFIIRVDKNTGKRILLEIEPQEDVVLCECCEAPNAYKSEGLYVCIKCDNFKCAECGRANNKNGSLINFDESKQKCLCDSCSGHEIDINYCENCGEKWANCECEDGHCEECGADDDNEMYDGRMLCYVCIECMEEN